MSTLQDLLDKGLLIHSKMTDGADRYAAPPDFVLALEEGKEPRLVAKSEVQV